MRGAIEDVQAAAHEMFDGAPGHRAPGKDLARAQLAEAEEPTGERFSNETLRDLLVPSDPNNGRNVIITIRGAEGGEEANLFAKDLYDMYVRYADRQGWKLEVLSVQPSDLGGIDEATFLVKGADAWQRLHNEGGAHRVQRVPVTESQGRVHTSSAAVTVLPEADEVEVELVPSDLRIDVYRSTGSGGRAVRQHDGLRRSHHAPADRRRRGDARRKKPDSKPRQGARGPAGAAVEDGTGPPGRGTLQGTPRPSQRRRPGRQDSDLQLQGEPRHRSPHRCHALHKLDPRPCRVISTSSSARLISDRALPSAAARRQLMADDVARALYELRVVTGRSL